MFSISQSPWARHYESFQSAGWANRALYADRGSEETGCQRFRQCAHVRVLHLGSGILCLQSGGDEPKCVANPRLPLPAFLDASLSKLHCLLSSMTECDHLIHGSRRRRLPTEHETIQKT